MTENEAIEFQRIWAASERIADVAAVLGLSTLAVKAMAGNLRRAGWELRELKRGAPRQTPLPPTQPPVNPANEVQS